MMKKIGIILGAMMFLLAAFWLGLMSNFPGKTASRLIEAQADQFSGVKVKVGVAELRLFDLYVPKVVISLRENPNAPPVFTLTDVSVPISWRLIFGLPAEGVIGKTGYVEVFLPWNKEDEAEMEGRVVLQEIPVPDVLKPASASGVLEVSSRIAMGFPLQGMNRFPKGWIKLKGEGVSVKGVEASGVKIPETRLESAEIDLGTGDQVAIKGFSFSGDLSGNIQGSLTPNMRNPRLSQLNFQIIAVVKEDWVEKFGDLKMIVQGFLKQNGIKLSLTGNLGRPKLQPVN